MDKGDSARLRVQTMFPRPFIGRGTDNDYLEKLTELERHYPVRVLPCQALMPVVIDNALCAADGVWGRASRRFGLGMPDWWSSLRRLTVVPAPSLAGADLVYTNFFLPANRINTPVILEWDFFVYGPPDEQHLVSRLLNIPPWFVRRATCVIVRHELSRAAFASRYPEDADKAVVLPIYHPWLEPVPEQHVVRKFEREGVSDIRLLFVGNDARRKGLPALAEAYERLRSQHRRVRFTVVSEFHDGRVTLAPDVIVRSRISRTDLFQLMSEAHIFAMPTRREAVGLVYVEAMANGCALLLPDSSPQRELFGDYGLSAPPDDVDALTSALKTLVDHPDVACTYGLRARRGFILQYHHSVVGKQYWEVFQRAAHARAT
jgi:glycosyltransferase involved in cell wall biosynthesis